GRPPGPAGRGRPSHKGGRRSITLAAPGVGEGRSFLRQPMVDRSYGPHPDGLRDSRAVDPHRPRRWNRGRGAELMAGSGRTGLPRPPAWVLRRSPRSATLTGEFVVIPVISDGGPMFLLNQIVDGV